MIKRFVTYWALPLAMLGFSSVARADIEAPQTVIGTVKTGIKEAESIQHDLNEIQADLRSAAEGVAGPIKDAAKTVNDVKNEAQSNIQAVKDKADAAKNIASDPEGALNTMGGKLPGFMTTVDTNDSGELRDAVKTNYFTQRPKSSVSADGQAEAVNSVEVTKEQDEKMAATFMRRLLQSAPILPKKSRKTKSIRTVGKFSKTLRKSRSEWKNVGAGS